jgi:hypothetical protein
MKKIKGSYLIFTALIATALVGVGALSLDLGRLFVLRSEMQNAADAAAMAAAAELTGVTGSRVSAEAAARNLLQHDSRFADVRPLLGNNIRIEFFCTIGSRYDPPPTEVNMGLFCVNGEVDGRRLAASDLEASYARVTLEPAANSQAYSVSLFLLPVLNATLGNVQSRSFLSARATAGQHFFACNFPPLIICNPFEAAGVDFPDGMIRGQQIRFLNTEEGGGGSWAPGNFGWMQNPVGSGAPNTAVMLADEQQTGCTRPTFTTEPGSMGNVVTRAINTRFGYWQNPQFGDTQHLYGVAPNIVAYPRDAQWNPNFSAFGNGVWNRDLYWATYHDWQHGGDKTFRPGNWATMTRWETYMWEIWGASYATANPDAVRNGSHQLPSRQPFRNPPGNNSGTNNTDRLYHGYPEASWLTGSTNTLRNANRRSFVVAVVNCAAQNVGGRSSFTLTRPDGFARLFMTEPARGPGSNSSMYFEYVSWADATEDDADFFVEAQLYE